MANPSLIARFGLPEIDRVPSGNGKGILTVRGVLEYRNHEPVSAEYEIVLRGRPDDLTGTLTAAPAALFAAFIGGYATLQLENGETVPIVVSEIAGNRGWFKRRLPAHRV